MMEEKLICKACGENHEPYDLITYCTVCKTGVCIECSIKADDKNCKCGKNIKKLFMYLKKENEYSQMIEIENTDENIARIIAKSINDVNVEIYDMNQEEEFTSIGYFLNYCRDKERLSKGLQNEIIKRQTGEIDITKESIVFIGKPDYIEEVSKELVEKFKYNL